MSISTATRQLALPLSVAILLLSLPVAAAERLFLAGAQGDGASSYTYAGLIAPIGNSQLGNGFVQRYWFDHTTYRYQSAAKTIHAQGWGAEAIAGYQQSGNETWWGVYSGIRYQDTRLSPDDASSTSRGEKWRLKLQAEGQTALNQTWYINGNLSYIPGQRGYWGRIRLLSHTSWGIDIGPEFVMQGDPEYSARQLGLVLAHIQPAKDTELTLKIGLKHNTDDGSRKFVGLEFSHGF